jgi:invasion protein IalB
MVQSTSAPSSITFNAAMQAQYPSYCLDVLDCKKNFRQHVVSNFLDNQKFVLTVPFADGRSLTFEVSLNGFTENYGKYEYTSSTSSRKKESRPNKSDIFKL